MRIAAGLLPGAVRDFSGSDDRRGIARARHAGKIRCADKENWAQESRGQVMSIRIFVPRDSAALALGADAVAQAILAEAARRNIDVELVRNGSRGMLWLEPLVEVQTAKGRVAYGSVSPADVSALFDADFLHGGKHALGLGLTEELAYLKKQERLTFARVGITDPLSLDDYLAHDGYQGLRKALTMQAETFVEQVTDSGLRGRGGAAFPTGIKWKTVLNTAAKQKYIVCNADEGDSGTFSDRMLMEGDPFVLVEGMTIAALAVGATQGYIYVRSEYPHSISVLSEAIAVARKAGYLGSNILDSGKRFELEVRKAAGAYVCGEETAMLESLEGKRGIVRAKPPLPAIAGLFGKPTVINNVISLASVPVILAKGVAFYKDYGMGRSRGTLPFQLAGNIKRGDQPATFDVARQLERQRAARTTHAIVLVKGYTFGKDDRHAGQRNHVVDHGGLAEQAGDRGQRRLGPHDAALALQAFQHRGFLAAHVS